MFDVMTFQANFRARGHEPARAAFVAIVDGLTHIIHLLSLHPSLRADPAVHQRLRHLCDITTWSLR